MLHTICWSMVPQQLPLNDHQQRWRTVQCMTHASDPYEEVLSKPQPIQNASDSANSALECMHHVICTDYIYHSVHVVARTVSKRGFQSSIQQCSLRSRACICRCIVLAFRIYSNVEHSARVGYTYVHTLRTYLYMYTSGASTPCSYRPSSPGAHVQTAILTPFFCVSICARAQA